MTGSKKRILLIDDEISGLDQLKSSLATEENEWIIERSNNPQQALQSILKTPPTVVICDYDMPQINGADLLRQVEAKHPFIHRFIIANRAEMEVLEDGIGSVFHFLPKPCPGNRLIQEIQRCLAIEEWLGKEQIKSVVGTLGELPSLPNLYLKIVDALDSDDISVELIGKQIAKDLTISAKILKIVNSSYFGFDETISDINQAVSVLGIDTVKNLVLAIQVFGENREGEIGKATDRLWGHSMAVAQGMQFETGSAKLAEGAYTAGLFHDIGKLIMLRAAPEDFKVAQEKAQGDSVNAWETETEHMGCNHAEAGAYLLARWGLPIEVVETAALHHQPANSSGASFSALASVVASNSIAEDKVSDLLPRGGNEIAFIESLGKAERWPKWNQFLNGDLDVSESDGQDPSTIADSDDSAASSKFDNPSIAIESAKLVSDPKIEAPEPKSFKKKAALIALCAPACAIFAIILFKGNNDQEAIAYTDDWESGSLATKRVANRESATSATESRFPTITVKELVDEITLEDFETVTTKELVKESYGPIRFPKIRVTQIYHDLPIPVAQIDSKLVRIGDKVSGAELVDIHRKNVVLQIEGKQKSYSVK